MINNKCLQLFGCNIWSYFIFSLAVLVLVYPTSGFAQMYQQPRSFSLKDKSIARVEHKVLPKINIERLVAEARKRDQDLRHPGPHHFAVAANVAYTLDNSGTWQTLADGRLWRLAIQSPGAKSINLGFANFDMPKGAKLWIYDPEYKHVEGPYTARNRSRHGRFWTPVIEGDQIVVEVFVPTGVRMPVLKIGKVNQGFRGFGRLEKNIPGGGAEGACENDVICPVGDPWRDQIRAVGAYTLNGTADCTGTMMNDTAVDRTPYFLSANHCQINSTNDDTVVVYWNYESPTCGTHGPGSTADNQSGSIYRASYAPSDFVLVELSAQPDPSFHVYYAGWDISGTTPPSTVDIHHPAVDVKAISFSNTPPQITSYFTDTPNTYHWRADWDSGVTEPGSSGSCLFETAHKRCIGVLTGGPSYCGAASTDLHDFFGMLSVSWLGGGTNASQLKHWLDNANTGTMQLDGDPHVKTADGTPFDFQGAGEYVTFRNNNGVEIQTRQTPVSTASVLGPNAHTGLTTCVSLNTAVAARVGKHRVTYEPDLSGVPNPSGLQLRVDGNLTTLGANGMDLGGGGRLMNTNTSGGLQVDFPDSTVLLVTPGWWSGQSKWYLNVDVVHGPTDAMDGIASERLVVATERLGHAPASGGIMGAIVPGSWFPALPDGTSMGSIPGSLHQRYLDLYQKFGKAWRVTNSSTLFDYAHGASTNTYTVPNWPLETPPCVVPESKPAKPVSKLVAERVCRAIRNKNTHNNCVFDVRVTGNTKFARTYLQSERILKESTKTTLVDDADPTQAGEWVTFIATVVPLTGSGTPHGTVQFMVDSVKTGLPIKLDATGHASWETSRLKVGKHSVAANYIPNKAGQFLPSSSGAKLHIVRRCICESSTERK